MEIKLQAKFYGTRQVLGQISLLVAPGEVLALTGPSGIGKSTLVRIIAGLDTRFEGRITNVGPVGFVFQEPTLLPWRTLLENLSLVTDCDTNTALSALDQVGLGARAGAFPGQLSLGQQRRVALARALATKPQTLILDEAFASLDESTATKMRALTLNLLEKNSFCSIIVTHNLKEAVAMADRILLMDGHPAQIVLDHHIESRPANRDIKIEANKLRACLDRLGR